MSFPPFNRSDVPDPTASYRDAVNKLARGLADERALSTKLRAVLLQVRAAIDEAIGEAETVNDCCWINNPCEIHKPA